MQQGHEREAEHCMARPRPFKCWVSEKTCQDPATLLQHQDSLAHVALPLQHLWHHVHLVCHCDPPQAEPPGSVYQSHRACALRHCRGKFTQLHNLISHLHTHTFPS